MMRETVWELLNAGDWACAEGDAEALARVVRRLVPVMEPPLVPMANRIIFLTQTDPIAATVLWSSLASHLRGEQRRRQPPVPPAA